MIIQYSFFDLLLYLLLYSFIGWGIEALIISVKNKEFINLGILNLPFKVFYGISAVILMEILPTLNHNVILQYGMIIVVLCMAGSIYAHFVRRMTGEWEKEQKRQPGLKELLIVALISAVYLLWLLVVHPLICVAVNMMPDLVVNIAVMLLMVLIAVDFMSIVYSLRTNTTIKRAELRKAGTYKLGARMAELIWKRLQKAYPGIRESEDTAGKYVFAKGLCVDKLIWVFLISAFLGALIEMLFCRITGGLWMNRSSLLYGSFSIVWGLGAVVLTITLRRLADKEDRKIFLGGFVIGGVYEYMCSVFTQIVFGTVFWDYSEMPLNIGGRTNVLYCIFWGLLSVVWIKVIYPPMERCIEKFPPLPGKIVTWVVLVIIACDGILTAGAMIRYTARKESAVIEEINFIQEFLDVNYDDAWMEKRWPNMCIAEVADTV